MDDAGEGDVAGRSINHMDRDRLPRDVTLAVVDAHRDHVRAHDVGREGSALPVACSVGRAREGSEVAFQVKVRLSPSRSNVVTTICVGSALTDGVRGIEADVDDPRRRIPAVPGAEGGSIVRRSRSPSGEPSLVGVVQLASRAANTRDVARNLRSIVLLLGHRPLHHEAMLEGPGNESLASALRDQAVATLLSALQRRCTGFN